MTPAESYGISREENRWASFEIALSGGARARKRMPIALACLPSCLPSFLPPPPPSIYYLLKFSRELILKFFSFLWMYIITLISLPLDHSKNRRKVRKVWTCEVFGFNFPGKWENIRKIFAAREHWPLPFGSPFQSFLNGPKRCFIFTLERKHLYCNFPRRYRPRIVSKQ